MTRRKHPRKHIESALRHAEAHGWRVIEGGSHAWGKMRCPHNLKECRCGEYCLTSVWSTPRNDVQHARILRQIVDKCVADDLLDAGEE